MRRFTTVGNVKALLPSSTCSHCYRNIHFLFSLQCILGYLGTFEGCSHSYSLLSVYTLMFCLMKTPGPFRLFVW